MVYLGDAQLGKKHVGHVGVKVLAGVHQHLRQPRCGGNGVADHAGLDELWTGAQDGEDFHGGGELCF